MIVVLVVVVVVEVVGDATSSNAGTQSSLTARATSTAGPKLVLLIDTGSSVGKNDPSARFAL
jgi:hypothetical protein